MGKQDRPLGERAAPGRQAAEPAPAATRSGFQWNGQYYTVDKQSLLAWAGQMIREGLPAEALRFKDWAVIVDGQPVSAKWLFSLATDASQDQFSSARARRLLKQIGIDARRMERTRGVSASSTPEGTKTGKVQQRDEFLANVASQLERRLPDPAGQHQIRRYPGRNYVRVFYSGFPRSHYELWLAREFDQVAFHLEGRREDNLARLPALATQQEELSATLGRQVVAEPWGPNWARLAMNFPPAPWTDGQAAEYAALLGRFIGVTLPVVRQAFADTQRRAPAKAMAQPAVVPLVNAAAHATLDRKIAAVQSFLHGRNSRPSDEVLCDWVQFCYTFELFAEGQQLFDLVSPSEVNSWLYERTKRLAVVCRMRATSAQQQE